MARVLLFLVGSVAIVYVGVCLLVWFTQDRLIWFPGPAPAATPASIGARYDDLVLDTSDGARIHAWHLRCERPRGAVLVCHGNAGNIEGRLPLAQAFLNAGFDVLLFDYRGYGRSTGSPSEEGTYLDAVAAYDHLAASGFTPERIVLHGESLGGAVATELALRRPVAALSVEASFARLADVGADVYPWLPVRLLLRTRYDSVAKMPEVGARGIPLLVGHSPADEIVPIRHGRRLFDAHPGPKEFLETAGPHNAGGFLQRPEWRETVRAFLEKHVAPL